MYSINKVLYIYVYLDYLFQHFKSILFYMYVNNLMYLIIPEIACFGIVAISIQSKTGVAETCCIFTIFQLRIHL